MTLKNGHWAAYIDIAFQEETFGPLATIIRAKDENDAIEIGYRYVSRPPGRIDTGNQIRRASEYFVGGKVAAVSDRLAA